MPHGSGLSMWLLVALIIVVWPIGFVALWSAIISLMSVLSGWHRLAGRYRAKEHPIGGRALISVSGRVNWASYKRVLTVTPDEHGMFIEISWVFRIAHPTLFIPWSDIRNARRVSQIFWQGIAFDVGDPRLASMRLPSDVFTGTPVFID